MICLVVNVSAFKVSTYRSNLLDFLQTVNYCVNRIHIL